MPRLLLPLGLALLVLALLLWRRPDGDGSISQRRLIMGTLVEISVPESTPTATEAMGSAFAEMERIERLMSPHLEGSDLQKLGIGVSSATVSDETLEVLQLALSVQQRSNGAFDPALGALIALWGVETETPRKPSPEEIRTALAPNGPQSIRIEADRVLKRDPGLEIDLGGIAKGFAVDRAIAKLKEAGVTQAAVNAGGDIRLLGTRAERPWRIALQHPRDPEKILATLELEDRALVSSGDYERYFEIEGVRYHHLLDPRTGYPARLCQSVSVLAGSAALADALATAAFVLGPREGMALIEGTAEAEMLLVDALGSIHISSGLKGKVLWP